MKMKSHDNVPKSILARFMMLLKDIQSNYFRVSEILRRMKVIFEDEYAVKEHISRGLKSLAQERLISDDQFNTLMAMVDTLNMEKLIQVVVNEKIGRGIQFLPRKTEDLQRKLGEWSKMYHEEASPGLKNKILASLHELKFRKAIDQQNYMNILNDIDNL